MRGSPCQPTACLYRARAAVLSLLQLAGADAPGWWEPGL